MRLTILDSGHGFGMKMLFAFIRAASRRPIPEAVKLVMYRRDFYGTPMGQLTHEAMRGPSAWSVGDRELMAAYVSMMNESEYCVRTHSAVAARAYQNEAKVTAVLSDLETAAIEEPLRATLMMLGKLTRQNKIDADDLRALLKSGVSGRQIEDALAICFAFNVMGRLANAFGFFIGEPKDFESGARYLLARGYR